MDIVAPWPGSIKSIFDSSPIRMSINNFEKIFVFVNICSMEFIFSAVYLPPNNPVQLYELYISSIENILFLYSLHSIIICSDYNLSKINWTNVNLGFVVAGASTPASMLLTDYFSFFHFFQYYIIHNSIIEAFSYLFFLIPGIFQLVALPSH